MLLLLLLLRYGYAMNTAAATRAAQAARIRRSQVWAQLQFPLTVAAPATQASPAAAAKAVKAGLAKAKANNDAAAARIAAARPVENLPAL